jgi:transposase
MYRGVPQKFVHLYLAELSYRFNHRQQDLYPLLHKALSHTDCKEIEPILVRSA